MKSIKKTSKNKTLVVSIGNSDDKLPQAEWSQFVEEMDFLIRSSSVETHFFGGSETYKPWQNVLWMVEIERKHEVEIMSAFSREVIELRKKYKQDSIFAMYSLGAFI